MDTNLGRLDATAQAELVRRGEVTSIELVEAAIERIHHKLITLGEREVHSEQIGEWVMEELRDLDQVAFVRFASVYRNFRDVSEFRDEIERLESEPPTELKRSQLSLLPGDEKKR